MEPTRSAIAVYRELAPCAALAAHVHAFFTFGPVRACAPSSRAVLRETFFAPGDSFCSPLLADGNVSLVLSTGMTCELGGHWRVDPAGPSGRVIGPMTMVGETDVRECAEGVGVYFRAAQASTFVGMPIGELTDRIIGADDAWGGVGRSLPSDLCELDDLARVDRLEGALLERLARERSRVVGIDAAGLASRVLECDGRVTVESLAEAAGVSRQHLARVFRDRIGLAPKTYCSLARFQSGLVYAGRGGVDWAQAAAAMGYADQSHMISEFRRFSSLTPQTLAAEAWFHPFIERARRRTLATSPSRARRSSGPSAGRARGQIQSAPSSSSIASNGGTRTRADPSCDASGVHRPESSDGISSDCLSGSTSQAYETLSRA
jgi:AraC-like DNA-binding protein